MEIKKINVHPVLICKENDSVREVAQKLREHKERRIFVVDGENKLNGLVTTTDLVYNALCDNCDKKVRDVMTKSVKSVDITDNLENALEIMNEVKSFAFPVTDNGKILGIILYPELLSYVYKEIQK